MSKDYYKTLGLEKSASKDDVKKAFRKLAHEHHPDKNKGNAASEQKFKEASEAYSVLSDDQKRAQYDRFGSAGMGGGGFNPGAGGFGGQGFGGFDFSGFQQGGGGFHFNQGGVEFDLGDIFGDFFGGGRRPRKGRNITVDVELTFKDSIFGIEKEINVESVKLAVKIPAGIENGQGLRIGGKGEDGPGGKGDLIVRVWVKEHAHIRKEGFDLVMQLPIKLTTALAGGSMDIETLDGTIELKIPAGTSHGEILRVKGKGVPYENQGSVFGTGGRRGDLLVVTHIEMPRKLSKKAKELIEGLKEEGV
ncbi:MAG: J domain-containing protein [Candidatus Pacebacteria bacterium]|nr:J domain-containing protein [Candidatus Paceibacterota bacterium]